MSRGWVKLWRKTQDSDMYKNLNSKQRDIMINILMLANHEERTWEWQGELQTCEPGQFKTSLSSLQEVCADDVSTQNIRTAIEKLEQWDFLTNKSTNSGRVITVVNWEDYQEEGDKGNKENNKEVTSKVKNSVITIAENKNIDLSENQLKNITQNLTKKLTKEQQRDSYNISGIESLVKDKLTKQVTNSQQRGNKEVTTNKNNKELKNGKKTNNGKQSSPSYSEIINYLNKKTNRNFKLSIDETREKIKTRFDEGFELEDFKNVIDTKVADWKNDNEMQKYLRPGTLFSDKFEGYLNEDKPKDDDESSEGFRRQNITEKEKEEIYG